ncbi:MAG: hypothetical protein H7Y02_12030 [Candidatus Obscuribacterales bacterium]|nr:hypothetical protein [Steroidobacteraceae bacterium]
MSASTEIHVPISPGELIDKITILEIKSERMSDAKKVTNVRHELSLLQSIWQASSHASIDIRAEWAALKEINGKLWVIEDDIRDKERDRQFDARFIELARAVYVTNDERAAIKRKINDKLGSKIVEEKSYADYRAT